jgi:hypothetical protein
VCYHIDASISGLFIASSKWSTELPSRVSHTQYYCRAQGRLWVPVGAACATDRISDAVCHQRDAQDVRECIGAEAAHGV